MEKGSLLANAAVGNSVERADQSRGRKAEVFKVVNHVGRGKREETEVAIFKWAQH